MPVLVSTFIRDTQVWVVWCAEEWSASDWRTALWHPYVHLLLILIAINYFKKVLCESPSLQRGGRMHDKAGLTIAQFFNRAVAHSNV